MHSIESENILQQTLSLSGPNASSNTSTYSCNSIEIDFNPTHLHIHVTPSKLKHLDGGPKNYPNPSPYTCPPPSKPEIIIPMPLQIVYHPLPSNPQNHGWSFSCTFVFGVGAGLCCSLSQSDASPCHSSPGTRTDTHTRRERGVVARPFAASRGLLL